ncbi:Predicted metal-dependent hydrolase, TIM-barrel fold [Clostridium acidisoli DSM 12555]|uniref:6-methylsalicylate decarboxylase n=1 Tax=Clostridium acidisoli DSM 12555 TaxID=1121291 RepID=A0A1W1XHR0_9CLOT|nr:amidohydrolase family protein [Clostridium acidisoli]SMC23367.1 Predicted metal-dependent hydrolase, TIM-barrel fold [Clostridium acidisoli DSM 12555]
MENNVENLIKNYKGNGILKIDMHAHYLPQAYKDALLNSGEKNPDGFPTPKWDPEVHLKTMQQLGISRSMLSISSPHINFGDRNAAKILARKVNEDGAELVKKYPGRFGLLASLPLPNVEDSIEEIQYTKDILHVDGFALPTNTQGVYLGNPCLDLVFEELNRHKAVVVLHPNKPSNVPENVVEGLPIPMMEFFFDTTRTVINMILKGTLKKFPDIKFIIPHAGAFLPILADRIASAIQMTPDSFGENIKGEADRIDIYDALKNLYYDVAGVCLPRQLADLLQIVNVEHLLYGSDYPYTSKFGCIILADALDKTNLLNNEQRRAIYHDNALKLFPHLKLG